MKLILAIFLLMTATCAVFSKTGAQRQGDLIRLLVSASIF
ncbi:hypothetical protein AAKU67_001262 [Oxalobacteraceae bacterium GrIS 2.11]